MKLLSHLDFLKSSLAVGAALVFIAPVLFAAEPTAGANKVSEEITAADATENVLIAAEQMPQYPGGDRAVMQFVADHLVYPQECADSAIQGRVVVKFVINKDGSIGETQVLRSPHPLLSAEAVRVVKMLSGFQPGMSDGKPVAVWFTLPVHFKLQDNNDSHKALEKLVAIYAERQQKEYDKFVKMGEQAEVDHNKDYAIAYYKEAFAIMPVRTDMINRCEKLIGDDKAALADLYKSAYKAIVDGNRLTDDQMTVWTLTADLFERLDKVEPLDAGQLAILTTACYIIGDEKRMANATKQIYALKDKADVTDLGTALFLDADLMLRRGDYKGVVKLIQPRLKRLLHPSGEANPTGALMALAQAQNALGKSDDARNTLLSTCEAYPEGFAARMSSLGEDSASRQVYEDFKKLLGE